MTYVAVDVPPVDRVGAHVGVQVPQPNSVVARAGDKRAGGKDTFHSFLERRIRLHTPNAGRVVQERMRLSHLRNRRQRRPECPKMSIFSPKKEKTLANFYGGSVSPCGYRGRPISKGCDRCRRTSPCDWFRRTSRLPCRDIWHWPDARPCDCSGRDQQKENELLHWQITK